VREQRSDQLNKAEALATRLITEAPGFAEAYNQRAIIYFIQGRYVESAEDCQRVIERNPFHIGAIEGLAQCQLSLNRRRDALKSLRRALKLRPHNSSLRESIHELEKNIE
jgi:tetratricopeptide (TPR) repeat protein